MCGMSVISSMLGGSQRPSTVQLPSAPSDTVAQEAAQRTRAAAAKKNGRASTILTGNQDTGYTPTVKKLLGE